MTGSFVSSDFLNRIVIAAGKNAIDIRESGRMQVWTKVTNGRESEYTNADLENDELLNTEAAKEYPHLGVISEEKPESENLDIFLSRDEFLVADMLDGTWSYVRGKGFAINLAQVVKGVPVKGSVYLPVEEQLFFVGDDGKAYFEDIKKGLAPREIKVKPFEKFQQDKMNKVVGGQGGYTEMMADLEIDNIERRFANNAKRICEIAKGSHHICLQAHPTSIWDTAAPHGVLLAAGGDLYKYVKFACRKFIIPIRYDGSSVVFYKGKDYHMANEPYIGGNTKIVKAVINSPSISYARG